MGVDLFNPSPALSRRKLKLKKGDGACDLSKAVVVYKPPGKVPGRSLACPAPPPDPPRTAKSGRIRTVISAVTAGLLLLLLCLVVSRRMGCDGTAPEPDLAFLTKELQRRVFGQEPAVALIASAVERLRIAAEGTAVVVLVGPSGTGKTHTTNVMAASLVDQPVEQARIHLTLTGVDDVDAALSCGGRCGWKVVFVEDSDFADDQRLDRFVPFLTFKLKERAGLGIKRSTSIICSDRKSRSCLD